MKLLLSTVRTALPLAFLLAGLGAAAALECSGDTTGQELAEPPTVTSNDYFLRVPLKATSVERCINGQSHVLKSYVIDNLPEDPRPVGPAIVLEHNAGGVYPTLLIDFENDLGKCAGPVCDCGYGGADIDLCTNLHTHGFHVSPAGNSDNVLLAFQPGEKFGYQYNLPIEHPPGTHWLHAHLHGSTAPQIREGMAGALILKGPIDTWLAEQGISDWTMILQQLADTELNGDLTPLCGGDITTSVNGQCSPKITAAEGEILRLRLIHAGVSASIFLSIRDEHESAIAIHEFARDGINLGKMIEVDYVELQPGYRSDVLFQVPKCTNDTGKCVLHIADDSSPGNRSLLGAVEHQEIIGTIEVMASDTVMSLPPEDDPHFAKPYPEIADSELVEDETKAYFAAIPPGGPGNENGKTTKQTVNGDLFPEGDPITLTLGQTQTWRVWVGDSQTDKNGPNHPFHIHVNPFEVILRDAQNNIVARYWKDTYLISATDNKGEANAVEMRSRYEDFIGAYVMHCHNLNHEDAGMMKLVEMKLPTSSAHDHH